MFTKLMIRANRMMSESCLEVILTQKLNHYGGKSVQLIVESHV